LAEGVRRSIVFAFYIVAILVGPAALVLVPVGIGLALVGLLTTIILAC
jgi:hypothetical protein